MTQVVYGRIIIACLFILLFVTGAWTLVFSIVFTTLSIIGMVAIAAWLRFLWHETK